MFTGLREQISPTILAAATVLIADLGGAARDAGVAAAQERAAAGAFP
jgi:hypothetical protein